MENFLKNNNVLLLDSVNETLGSANLLTPSSGETLEIQVLGGKEDEVAKHEVFNLVEVAGSQLSLQCRLLRRSGDRFVLERIALLDKSYWRNLRVPIRFASFIYPLPGSQWQGRQLHRPQLRRRGLLLRPDASGGRLLRDRHSRNGPARYP